MSFDMHRAITKAILEAVGTEFFLKTGGRAMTGDIDCDGNKILNCAEIDVSLMTRSLAGASMTVQPHWNKGYIPFRIWDGVDTWQTVLTMGKIGEFYAMVDIPRAGDITGLAEKTLNFPTVEGAKSDFTDAYPTHINLDNLLSEPSSPSLACLVCVDTDGWDPLGRGEGTPPYLVMWNGVDWKEVSAGTALTATKTFKDADGNEHFVKIINGRIESWDIAPTPP